MMRSIICSYDLFERHNLFMHHIAHNRPYWLTEEDLNRRPYRYDGEHILSCARNSLGAIGFLSQFLFQKTPLCHFQGLDYIGSEPQLNKVQSMTWPVPMETKPIGFLYRDHLHSTKPSIHGCSNIILCQANMATLFRPIMLTI